MACKKKSTFRLIFLFAFVFIVTSKIIRVFLPDPTSLYAKRRSEKLEMINLMDTTTNVSISGTSRILSGLDTNTFDEVAQKNGLPLKSINLGIEGGGYIEQLLMNQKFIEKQLALSNNKINKIIIFELNAGTNFDPIQLFTSRAINLYDFKTMINAINFSPDINVNFQSSIYQKSTALYLYLLNLMNTGMLSNYIFLYKKEINSELLISLMDKNNRGFDPLPLSRKLIPKTLNKSYYEKLLTFKYKYMVDLLSKKNDLENFNFAFIVTPVLVNKSEECVNFPDKIFISNYIVPIFNFSCPLKNPELFNTDLWSDTVHLNEKGAKLLSTLLAEKITNWLKEKDMANAFH